MKAGHSMRICIFLLIINSFIFEIVSGAESSKNVGRVANSGIKGVIELGEVSLGSGAYGVPFNVSLSEVLNWCQENNVVIANTTTKEIEEQVRSIIESSSNIKDAYDSDKSELPRLEQELLKLTTDKAVDSYRQSMLLKAQVLLTETKSPSFSYQGQEYLLEREFKDGVEFLFDGKVHLNEDDQITNAVYKLLLKPSLHSSRLNKNKVSEISIFFVKNNAGDFISYATFALFRIDDFSELKSQFNAINEVLTEKYGDPMFYKDWGMPREFVYPTQGGVTRSMSMSSAEFKEDSIEWDVLHFSGRAYFGYDALFWKLNIFLVARFRNDDYLNSMLLSEHFYVVHYEPRIVHEILNNYKLSVRNQIEKINREKSSNKADSKKDF